MPSLGLEGGSVEERGCIEPSGISGSGLYFSRGTPLTVYHDCPEICGYTNLLLYNTSPAARRRAYARMRNQYEFRALFSSRFLLEPLLLRCFIMDLQEMPREFKRKWRIFEEGLPQKFNLKTKLKISPDESSSSIGRKNPPCLSSRRVLNTERSWEYIFV